MSRVPRIRFKGFEEDWEQRKLVEVCNIITKQTGFDYSSTIKPALLKEKADNTYPFIQNKDFNGTTINMDTDFFIPIIVAEKFPNIVLDRPSILISISGRIGNVGFYSCVNKAFIGGAVGICKLKYNDDGKFIIHELESEYGQKYFYSLIKASSHANITIEDIRNMELIFPEKKEEKICISTFFSSFNHLITLHQRKLEKLKIIKKSMLENIFPQNGGKTPKIRFSGFTEDWEQRKLGEVTTSYSGGTPDVSNCEYYGDEIPFIRSGEINNFHTDLFITEKGLVNSSAAMVKEGDILYALYGATSGEVSRSKLKGAINQAILAILPKAKYDSEYIAQWLKTKKRYIVDTYLQGGQGNLSGNIVKNFIVDFSSYNEQLSIGNFASSLDHLITLHQSKLEKLQKIKKSMLESMFV